MCASGFIHGVISVGDYEKVRSFYIMNHRALGSFNLASPGGDVNEAIKIGRLMMLVSIGVPTQVDRIAPKAVRTAVFRV